MSIEGDKRNKHTKEDRLSRRESRRQTKTTVKFIGDRTISFHSYGHSLVFEVDGFQFTLRKIEVLSNVALNGRQQTSIDLGIDLQTITSHFQGLKNSNSDRENESFDQAEFIERARGLGLFEPAALTRLRELTDRFIGMSQKS